MARDEPSKDLRHFRVDRERRDGEVLADEPARGPPFAHPSRSACCSIMQPISARRRAICHCQSGLTVSTLIMIRCPHASL